ncbi:MAG: rhodoquinone biosynthesis methyltransferase RquA [Oxalobacteraceae bacterium]
MTRPIVDTHKKNAFNTTSKTLLIPAYLQKTYWWAYVHPRAVKIFERGWLVNLILFGNYAKLRNAALDEIGRQAGGRTLQIACVYGDLTPRLLERHAGDGVLDVVDVLPIQLQNLQRKLAPDSRISLFLHDSAALGFADGSYDRVLVFFLLHEQPENVRRSTLAEAFRVVRPGGKIVIVDYHRPNKWNLLRRPLQALLSRLEPFADDLWQHELAFYFPPDIKPASLRKQTYFGGLYQKIVLTR